MVGFVAERELVFISDEYVQENENLNLYDRIFPCAAAKQSNTNDNAK